MSSAAGSWRRFTRGLSLKELALQGIRAKTQVSYPVIYKGQCIGEYFADVIVEDEIVLELKCVDHLLNEHTAQCLNYLKASGHKLSLLINFQRPKVQLKRIVREL